MSISAPAAGDSRLVKPQFAYVDVRGNLYAPQVSNNVGWNASAVDFVQMPANAKVEFLPPVATVGGVLGIAAAAAQDYAQLTHAIYFTRGVAQALQGGALIGSTTTFVDDDVFAIDVASGVVTYKKNGTTFYTSGVASAGAVHVITAFLYAANDSIYNVVVTPAVVGSGSATGTATTRSPNALGGSPGGQGYALSGSPRVYGYSGLALHPAYTEIKADTAAPRVDALGAVGRNTGIAHVRPGSAFGGTSATYAAARAVVRAGTAYGTVGVRLDRSVVESVRIHALDGLQTVMHVSIISSLRFNELAAGSIVLPVSIISSLSISGDFHFVKMLQAVIESLGATDMTQTKLALLASIISSLSSDDRIALGLQTLHASVMERAAVHAVEALVGATAPHETWAVNIEQSQPPKGLPATNQSTRYVGYDFNSFCVLNGEAYGAKPDGIYRLDGADDSGVPIRSSMDFGKQRFGSSNFKAVPAAYVATASNGALFLKVVANGAAFIYKARDFDSDIATQRFDLGRGIRANYVEFELFNGAGFDFDLDTIEFVPVTLSRKI